MLLLVFSRICGDLSCEDTLCSKENTCLVFNDISLCKQSCGFPSFCKIQQIQVQDITFNAFCIFLDSGKIFAISTAIFVFLAIVSADIFLVIYCRRINKHSDVVDNGGVDDFEGITRIEIKRKNVHFGNVRGAIEAEIAGIHIVEEKERERDEVNRNGIMMLRDALVEQAIAERRNEFERGLVRTIESKISIFEEKILRYV
ncbi:hypothetical protein SS50377_24776 [Spironucleus salmonicida]|uniref:Uncharacterized protein n=1 Tax=Spironucleus salmonicida TaxID=348837 RepID=V6LV33_9EUKA|nr:hypothetical protein SS50377_24776 [Spironucleus salmonicida]|eukprot:EST44654.1 Hypothetical protein SS50377_15663 [Spironucleus salmonicida]